MMHTPTFTRLSKRLVVIGLFAALLAIAGSALFNLSAMAATSPTLGAAGSYSILAGQTVTNTGPTTMPGNLGVSPGSAVTGFPPGTVGPPGTIHAADSNAAAAQASNTAAFGALTAGANAACTQNFGAVVKDLSGLSLVPGVYCTDVGGVGAFTLTGTLTLQGSGVWIFRSGSTLITSGTARVVGGDPCDVWWRVPSSATLGTNTSLVGNILALTSISLQSGATLNGRALAQSGAVTLNNNTITGSNCLPSSGTSTTTPAAGNTSAPGPSPSGTATVAPTQAVSPTTSPGAGQTPQSGASLAAQTGVQPPSTGDGGLLQATESRPPVVEIGLAAALLLVTLAFARWSLNRIQA